MEKKYGFGIIGIAILITAICFAGCSTTSTSPTGLTLSGVKVLWEQKNIPTTDMKGEPVKVSIKVTGPNYLEVEGDPVSSLYGINAYGQLIFDVTLKNNGETSTTITGARVFQNGEKTEYGYAHYADKERGYPTVTIEPGKTGKCLWTAASPLIGDTSYELVIIASSSSGGVAKAQTGTAKVASTQTQSKGGATIQATSTPAAAATQVAEEYFAAAWRGDSKTVKTLMNPSTLETTQEREGRIPGYDVATDIKLYLQSKGGTTATRIEDMKISSDGQWAYCELVFLNNGQVILKKDIALQNVSGLWRMANII